MESENVKSQIRIIITIKKWKIKWFSFKDRTKNLEGREERKRKLTRAGGGGGTCGEVEGAKVRRLMADDRLCLGILFLPWTPKLEAATRSQVGGLRSDPS